MADVMQTYSPLGCCSVVVRNTHTCASCMVRLKIIGNEIIKNVDKSESCVVSKFKRIRMYVCTYVCMYVFGVGKERTFEAFVDSTP